GGQFERPVVHPKFIIVTQNELIGTLRFYLIIKTSVQIFYFFIKWLLIIHTSGNSEQHILFPIGFYRKLCSWREYGFFIITPVGNSGSSIQECAASSPVKFIGIL